ncbi:MAG: LysM peptidoglycan-binding domain-containing protein [Saprospiraceae bacterium]|nr:LysM peptidoglycan-binding domain-containing protein [Saprospiraceae bacterium]
MKKFLPALLFCWLMLPGIGSAQEVTPKGATPSSKLLPMDNPKRKAKPQPTLEVDIQQQAEEVFGNELREQLEATTTIKVYKVEQFVSEETNVELLEGFKVLQVEEISGEQYERYHDLLNQPATFLQKEELFKQCYFLPAMGIHFVNAEDTVTALISLECDMVRFYYQDESGENVFRTVNSDPGHNQLQDMYTEVFPAVAALQPTKEAIEPLAMQLVEEPVYYKVKSGEGWIKIAKRASKKMDQKTTVKDICKWNNIAYDRAMKNEVYPLKGETVIIGFK